MGHVFHQLYYHFTWATHAREPHLDRSYRPAFLKILNEEVKTRGGQPIRHNSMPDHVHLLVRLPPTVSVSEFIGQVKGATAYRTNHEIEPKFKLRWQSGYGVLTLRKDELEKVSRYIDNQEQHHRSGRLSELLETADTEEDDWEAAYVAKADGKPPEAAIFTGLLIGLFLTSRFCRLPAATSKPAISLIKYGANAVSQAMLERSWR